jgi:probable selenium-dependent hydroxylase accessory protein YqeC
VLRLFDAKVVTIIGSGGKTSLLWALAGMRRASRTLVTTTTRILLPHAAAGLYDTCITDGKAPRTAKPGVTLAGTLQEGKFRALAEGELEKCVSLFDYLLIEGDGSRTLPLKAWAAHEPVVPPFTGLTAGIIPVWPLGRAASDALIHRLPLWEKLTGGRAGEPVLPLHLARAISGGAAAGLFTAARGEKALFFNQIEDADALEKARSVYGLLPRSFCATLAAAAAGSVRRREYTALLP